MCIYDAFFPGCWDETYLVLDCILCLFGWRDIGQMSRGRNGNDEVLVSFKEEEDLLPFVELYFSIHPKLGGRPVLFLSHLSSILVSFLSFQPNKERRGWASIFLWVSYAPLQLRSA